MCATTGRSAGRRRRRRCSTTRAIAAASIPQAHLAGYAGILQADAYGGYNKLYEADRKPGPIIEAACWVHARRPFFVLADLAANARRKAQGKTASVISPLALEAVRRIDALFEIERAINGQSAERRRAVRQELSAPLVADLERWLREQRPKLSRGNDLAKAMDYMLKRWPAFTRFLDDGRICLSNNAAERALRGIALGRKSWLFAGSDRGGQRAAAMYSLIVTAKLNDVDPQAWLADVLARIAEHPAQRHRRAAAVELAAALGTAKSGGLIMAAIAPSSPSATSPTCSARTKTGCTSCRSTCSRKTAASGSTASARMACPPSPRTASRTCARSSPTNEPPAAHRRRSNPPNSPACGAHRMDTLGTVFSRCRFPLSSPFMGNSARKLQSSRIV